ncbi:MAG TPA: oxygen-dependent coproporphyrinogen oxidase [Bacteroidota bacterium]|jgi:coproporphyrinogen III oxidase
MFKLRVQQYFETLQNTICSALAEADGKGQFREDRWAHPEKGGGVTRVLENGAIFEKAGVNFSAVESGIPAPMAAKLGVDPQPVFATGVSLILHPVSPMIPTVHMNLRYLELANGDAWFGGGADLTPNYLHEEDVAHFHGVMKAVCDRHDSGWHLLFKRACDEYFFIRHRQETRGVGGIFFDYRRDNPGRFFLFVTDLGDQFLTAYLPILRRRQSDAWGPAEKKWQLLRRGRYVEFNLLYDRGTLFGLETQGRIESILVSLPPEARWDYCSEPEPGSREAELLNVLREPRDWI